MNTEEMIQFRKLIEENCELKDDLEWQKRNYVKAKALAEIVSKYGLVTNSTERGLEVVMGVIDGEDAIKLCEIVDMKEV